MVSPIRPFTALCLACLEPDRVVTVIKEDGVELTWCRACGQTKERPAK